MITIVCKDDLARYGEKFSASFTRIIESELDQLTNLLDSEEIGPLFRTDSAGYQIICLEEKEPENSLASIGLSAPFHQVEYVEIHDIGLNQFYRILLMHDNESFTIVLSPLNTQLTELEAWLRMFGNKGGHENGQE
ncbi:hypothetical protein [Paenibacillus timonensis]|uniref:hypothetical protein n=1 Tax=Paenibacillus timonensis TaxID=225915 RepID=UPI003F9697B6